jgi:hypothetical protein
VRRSNKLENGDSNAKEDPNKVPVRDGELAIDEERD